MAIKFGFCDECGTYNKNRSDRQKKIHPYYVRGLILMDADQYKDLTTEFNGLKRSLGFRKEEIKWSYIWSLRSCQKNGTTPKQSRDFYFLKDIDYHKIIDFAEDSLKLLQKVKAKTIFTITNNKTNLQISEKALFKMHITTLLQRVQYETQNNTNNLSVLFFDPLNNKKSKQLREIYHEIYTNGDFVENYSSIKDSLNLEYSHHSVGIQLSDFLVGTLVGVLKVF